MSTSSDGSKGLSWLGLIRLPSPWPVQQRAVFARGDMRMSTIELAWLPDRRIEGIVALTSGQVWISNSCQIATISDEPHEIILVFTVNEAGNAKWRISGRDANANAEEIRAHPRPASARSAPPLTRDDVGIEKARVDREDRLKKETSKAGSVGLDRSRMWNMLDERIRHLPTATSRARANGANDLGHLAVLLRQLLAPGRGNDLLFLCAADVKLSLLIWGRPPVAPNLWTPRELFRSKVASPQKKNLEKTGVWATLEFFELEPRDFQTHCMDLETWLNRSDGWIVDRDASALMIIKEVADKFGAHADHHDFERIDILRNTELLGHELATLFLVPLAERIARIGEDLLSRKSR